MDEAHCSRLSIHRGGTKMYYDMYQFYMWPGMKKVIGDYVSQCSTCQWVKVQYQHHKISISL